MAVFRVFGALAALTLLTMLLHRPASATGLSDAQLCG